MLSFKSYRSIRPEDRIILSPDTKVKFRNVQQGKDFKPKGLWYAAGTSWMDWIESEMPDWKYKKDTKDLLHVHKLEINQNAIIQLQTKRDVIEFEEEYGVEPSYGASVLIDWEHVAKKYAGIECIPYFYGLRDRVWYNIWDVPSGCIWSNRGIKSIKLIE